MEEGDEEGEGKEGTGRDPAGVQDVHGSGGVAVRHERGLGGKEGHLNIISLGLVWYGVVWCGVVLCR